MMKTVSRKGGAAILGLGALIAWTAAGAGSQGLARAATASSRRAFVAPPETAESIVMRWPPRSRNAAGLMLEKYGAPDQFDRDTLVWFNNGVWKKTIVHRSVARRDPAGRTRDFLEQTIGYLVPSDKVADLARFSPMIEISQTAGDLTFSSDSEAKNRLALNLADEIVTGKRDVADARAYFLKTSRLSASGKSSSYLDGLLFEVDNTRTMIPTGADR